MYNDVKYVIMAKDVTDEEFVGIRYYGFYLNKRKTKIKLYSTITGPKFLQKYIKSVGHVTCYEVRSMSTIEKYKNQVYMLRKNGSYYSICKLIPQRKVEKSIATNKEETNAYTKRLVKKPKSR